MKSDDYQYYDWEGFLCRSQGDVFSGAAEKYFSGSGWKTCHFLDLLEKGAMLTKSEVISRCMKNHTFNLNEIKAILHVR